MIYNPKMYDTLPIGVILRKQPGLTRWAKWHWTAASVVVGVNHADWREVRQEGEVIDYLAGAVQLELHGAETGAYIHELNARVPSLYVIMRETDTTPPFEIVTVTASPYEAQDYADNGEDIVEKVPMSDGVSEWIKTFVNQFHNEDPFVKRKRDKMNLEKSEDGIGDPRVRKTGDIYASPALKRGRLQ